MLDVIAGSLTTLVAAYLTWMLRSKSKYLASVPPVVLNALVIPWVLKYGYGEPSDSISDGNSWNRRDSDSKHHGNRASVCT